MRGGWYPNQKPKTKHPKPTNSTNVFATMETKLPMAKEAPKRKSKCKVEEGNHVSKLIDKARASARTVAVKQKHPRSGEAKKPLPIVFGAIDKDSIALIPHGLLKDALLEAMKVDEFAVLGYNGYGSVGRFVQVSAQLYKTFSEEATTLQTALQTAGMAFPTLPEGLSAEDYMILPFSTFATNYSPFKVGIPLSTSIALLRAVARGAAKEANGFVMLDELASTQCATQEDLTWKEYLCETWFADYNREKTCLVPRKGRKGSGTLIMNFVVVKTSLYWQVLTMERDMTVCFYRCNDTPFPFTKDPYDDQYILQGRQVGNVKILPGLNKYADLQDRQRLVAKYGDKCSVRSYEFKRRDLNAVTGLDSLASVDELTTVDDIGSELALDAFVNKSAKMGAGAPVFKLFSPFGAIGSNEDIYFFPPSWGNYEFRHSHLSGDLPFLDELRLRAAPRLRCQGDEKRVKLLAKEWTQLFNKVPGDAILVGYVLIDGDWLKRRQAQQAKDKGQPGDGGGTLQDGQHLQ